MSNKLFPAVATCVVYLALALGAGYGIDSRASDLESIIQRTIENRHPPENEPEWWRSLGPETPGVLIRMYRETERAYFRMRLLQALAWFDDPDAVEFLKKEARETDEDLLRQAAIRTVGRSQGEKELAFLEEFLKHHDAETRLAAASAVQRIALESEKAAELLRKYRGAEKESWVVKKLDKQAETRERARLKVQPGPGTVEPLLEELPGEWQGQWLEPEPKKPGLKTVEADATLTGHVPKGGLRSDAQIRGTLFVGKGKERKEYSIASEQIKGSTIRGTLTLVPSVGAISRPKPRPPKSPPEKYSFTAEWRRRSAHSILQMDVARLAVTLVLRKK